MLESGTIQCRGGHVQISELARRAGVPVATVKYYLREGLLPPGERTGATRARYGEEHVERLRLVRALLGPGGLSIARARAVLAAVDSPDTSVHAALGAAHRALPGVGSEGPADLDRAQDLLRRRGGRVAGGPPRLPGGRVAAEAGGPAQPRLVGGLGEPARQQAEARADRQDRRGHASAGRL